MLKVSGCLLVALSALSGCTPVRDQIFALRDQDDGSGGLVDVGSGGGGSSESPVTGGQMLGTAGNKDDGGREVDGGQHQEDVDGGPFTLPCPEGKFVGTYKCDYEELPGIVVAGEVVFTVRFESGEGDVASIIEGTVRGFLPRSDDDLTPVADFAPVDLSGGVACADPHRLHAETTLTTLDTASDLPDVLQALAPVKAEMEGNFKADCFSGSFAVYGPPDCVGTFSACAQDVASSPDAGP